MTGEYISPCRGGFVNPRESHRPAFTFPVGPDKISAKVKLEPEAVILWSGRSGVVVSGANYKIVRSHSNRINPLFAGSGPVKYHNPSDRAIGAYLVNSGTVIPVSSDEHVTIRCHQDIRCPFLCGNPSQTAEKSLAL